MNYASNRLQYLVRLALLTAITVVLSFTYLPLGPISATLVMIPVVIGAIMLGPGAGTFLGLVFGLTSIFAAYRGDPWGTTLLNINQFCTWIVNIVPRVLMGFLSGVIFRPFKEEKPKLGYWITGLSGAVLNTLLYGVFLVIFFIGTYFQGASLWKAAGIYFAAVAIQATCEAVICCTVTGAVCIALAAYDRRASRTQ